MRSLTIESLPKGTDPSVLKSPPATLDGTRGVVNVFTQKNGFRLDEALRIAKVRERERE